MTNSFQKIQDTLNTFHLSYKSVILATKTPQNEPYTSYAPFVKIGNDIYLLISKIAQHFGNLIIHPDASIMMIEDENQTKNIFFRKRLSYLVETTLDVQFEKAKQAFIDTFGDFAAQLFTMDFIMVKCVIQEGTMIVGPGQAYRINDKNMIEKQMTGRGNNGHGQSK